MFDEAEKLLGARDDITHVREQSIGVGAIGTMKPLDDIKLFAMSSIANELLRARHFGNSVYREAARRIQGNAQVEQMADSVLHMNFISHGTPVVSSIVTTKCQMQCAAI